jgi:HrpA-like RNA helicase
MIRTGAATHSSLDGDDQWTDVETRKGRVGRMKSLQLLVIPLYASLPQPAQKLAFKSVGPNVRKCVVATNVAETSVTVPGIRCVSQILIVVQH